MLSIGAMGGGQAAYYVGLAREDYYLQGGEPPGIWQGQGAQDLRLSGTVEAEALNRLFAGFHPQDDRALIQNAGAIDHQPGWDLTFSAPKSVSVLWSQADPKTRKIIQDAHHDAVQSALFYIESEAAITRRGKGGHIKENAHLIVATFEHGTSRAQDPQLHTHCLLLNVCTRADGTSGTIESKPLYQVKMTAGALYRAEYAALLERRLDLTAVRKGSCFEVEGVSQSLMTEFSKRRAEIEAVLAEKGYHSAQAAAMATLITRQVKGHAAREALFKTWQETGGSLGWGREQASAFLSAARAPERNAESEKAEALQVATARATEQQSYFTERDFIRYFAEEAQGRGFGAGAVLAAGIAHLTGSREIVALGQHKGENVYTTREMMEIESRLLARVDESKGHFHKGVSETVLKGVTGSRQKLNNEQIAALRHLCDSDKGSIRIVSGMAGTGKTTLLDAARLAWTLEGFEVHGAALAGKAAKGLESGSRIASETLHRTLWDIEKGKLRLSEKSVLVLDEGGMVGTRQMERLVTATERAGARLVIVGDSKQLQPIEAGGALPEMENQLGAAALTTILRQRESWARNAVMDFSRGDADKALATYAERGLLSVSSDRRSAYGELVKAWCQEGGIRAPHEHLIFAGTRLDVAILNRMVQESRLKAGVLEQKQSIPAPQGGGVFHIGDRVMFTKNSRLYGVRNGDLGTVTVMDAEKKTIGVRLDADDARVSIDLNDFPHTRLGYAMTTHKGQGATIERSFVLVGGSMQDREITYVQASRAKGETRIFADQDTAGETLTRLVLQMSESRQKEMAHTVPQQHASPGNSRDVPKTKQRVADQQTEQRKVHRISMTHSR